MESKALEHMLRVSKKIGTNRSQEHGLAAMGGSSAKPSKGVTWPGVSMLRGQRKCAMLLRSLLRSSS